MAKKLMLSPTRITAFLECPLKYQFLYIDKIGRYYYRPKPGNTFGGTLHRALQSFHETGTEQMSVERLIEEYRQAWVSVGYNDQSQEQEFMDAGERFLRSYVSTVPQDVKTILTEKQVKWDMGDFALIGRLDRLDEHPDGALEIIDYKSGRLSVTEEEVRGELAMSIYQLIVRKLNPERRVFASIYALAGSMKASAELSDDELFEVEEGSRRVASAIMTAEEFRPRCSENCADCDFYRLCSRQSWFGNEV